SMAGASSKRRAVEGASALGRQLPSVTADRQIAHGRGRAWGRGPLARVAAAPWRKSTRNTTRPPCAPSCSAVDSRAFVGYPRGMSLPLHRPAPKARGREEVATAEWNDWRWQLRHRLTQLADLEQFVALTDEERRGVALAPELFRVGITPYYASLMDRERADCPVRMQVVPLGKEER